MKKSLIKSLLPVLIIVLALSMVTITAFADNYTGFVYDRDLVPGGRKYTDYTDQILDQTDILIDGPFVLEEKDIRLKFRGSRNQRILDMKQTRKSGQVVLSPLNK